MVKESGTAMVFDIFLIPSHSLKCALCAFLSILSSTSEGVEYLCKADTSIFEKLVDVLKDQDDGSVTQRFCLAALQKASANEGRVQETLIGKKGIVEWLSKFLERSRMRSDVNPFCYEFACALLANLLSTHVAVAYLSKNLKLAKDLINIILNLLKEKVTPTVLWYLLLGLSHLALNKEALAGPFEESYFSDKISDFQELYSQVNPNNGKHHFD